MRSLQAEWIEQNRELLRAVCAGMGFVVPSNGVVRGALTAILWLAPIPVHTTVHASMEEALDWAITEVDRTDGIVPTELLLGGAQLVAQRVARVLSA